MSDVAPFPIVGIGASAGGVEALQGFFEGLPADTGMGFVVVTHLSPERESLLPQIIQRQTTMEVESARDAVRVEPNKVYVLPARAVLGFSDGCLRMSETPAGTRERKPIDLFLSALAKDLGEYSVGVILSGGDGDGTLGSKAIKERGGLTIAQVADGDGPAHPDMPEQAISTGMIDLAIPAHEMGKRLVEFSHGFKLLDHMAKTVGAREDGAAAGDTRSEIYALLRNQTGHDFSGYKLKTFLRRVQRRMQVNHIETLEGFVELLRQESREVAALFRDLLINVTNFFRDEDAFAALAKQVIPKLFEGRGAEDTVRIWVPGCATGEEVFSLAILMREHMEHVRNIPRIQLFATDIDEPALSLARAARYPEALLDSVTPERRKRFFVKDGLSYTVAKDVRDMCIFSPHSVLRDPPFSRMDLISCRNLLIYFGAEAQNQVIPIFHYSLKPGGYLFLGTSENIGQFTDIFTPTDKKNRIFRSRDDGGAAPRLPLSLPALRLTHGGPAVTRRLPLGQLPLRQTIEAHMMERHTPPHVVVGQEGDIVYYSNRTGKYFEAPAGIPVRQLLPLARRGLRVDLRSALREAIESGRRVMCEGVEFETDEGRVQSLSVLVEPVSVGSSDPLYAIVFLDNGPPVSPGESAVIAAGEQDGQLLLERELRETRERLQSTVEEYETALEELKSSNEELVSVNEELQSTNEELEASKEELQSLNEELQTVNAELNIKVEALDRANADLNNLFEATDIATVFLDANLSIRNFTPTATAIFKILPGDRGRPLTDLVTRLNYPDLEADLHQVLKVGGKLERQIEEASDGRQYLLRVTAYRNERHVIDGVVVSAAEVTGLAKAESHLRVMIAELNHRVKNMLTVVQAVEMRTRRGSRSLDEFHQAFSGRLRAMTKAYELLSTENWKSVSLALIMRSELEPFGLDRVLFPEGDIELGPKQALSMGMVAHELATNAVKYGALSSTDGRIILNWSSSPDDMLDFRWRECDGPPIEQAGKPGFGLQLVKGEVSHGLGGKSEIHFHPDGLSVDLCFKRMTEDLPT